MSDKKQNVYVVWNPFQRRAESLGALLGLRTIYVHFKWEERGRLFKAMSYIPKMYLTLRVLLKNKPKYVFLQLAPTILLYTAAIYKLLTGNRYISDCHNTMIYDDHWIKWPFAKRLLRGSYITLVHNEDVHVMADHLHIESMILRDPLPLMTVPDDIREVAGIDLRETAYVIIPCSMAADEPVQELIAAAQAVPDVLFVMTWFREKLPAELRTQAPDNVRFTGFLAEPEFNALYAHANAALVLTTREGTQPSGAAEAISLGVPLVVSQLKTTTRLYKEAPVYVSNDVSSITAGVRRALESSETLSKSIAELRDSLIEEAGSQIESVKMLMNQ